MSEKLLNNVLNKVPDTMPEVARDLQGRARMRTTQHAGCTVQWREWGPQDGIPLVALHGGHGSWLRTLRVGVPPSERVVALALRNALPQFLADSP